MLGVCLCLGCGGVVGEWVGDLDQDLDGWCYVCVSLDPMCRWHVQLSVYCAKRIPAHLGCTQFQPCCTLTISASYRVFVCGRYRKSRLVCVWLSDLDMSRHRPFQSTLPTHSLIYGQ